MRLSFRNPNPDRGHNPHPLAYSRTVLDAYRVGCTLVVHNTMTGAIDTLTYPTENAAANVARTIGAS